MTWDLGQRESWEDDAPVFKIVQVGRKNYLVRRAPVNLTRATAGYTIGFDFSLQKTECPPKEGQ